MWVCLLHIVQISYMMSMINVVPRVCRPLAQRMVVLPTNTSFAAAAGLRRLWFIAEICKLAQSMHHSSVKCHDWQHFLLAKTTSLILHQQSPTLYPLSNILCRHPTLHFSFNPSALPHCRTQSPNNIYLVLYYSLSGGLKIAVHLLYSSSLAVCRDW